MHDQNPNINLITPNFNGSDTFKVNISFGNESIKSNPFINGSEFDIEEFDDYFNSKLSKDNTKHNISQDLDNSLSSK